MDQDIRWEQRFSNYVKALTKLSGAIQYIASHVAENPILDEIVKEGLIQRFEYTQELAWKVMKDYAEYQGITTVAGPRDAIREAFQLKLIAEGDIWMDMIKSRNQTSHTYNDETAEAIYKKIRYEYYDAFLTFKTIMEAKRSDWQQRLF